MPRECASPSFEMRARMRSVRVLQCHGDFRDRESRIAKKLASEFEPCDGDEALQALPLVFKPSSQRPLANPKQTAIGPGSCGSTQQHLLKHDFYLLAELQRTIHLRIADGRRKCAMHVCALLANRNRPQNDRLQTVTSKESDLTGSFTCAPPP